MKRWQILLASVGHWVFFAWQAGCAAGLALGNPRAVAAQLYAVLIGSLSLGLVTGIALGAVVWMHTYTALARTGTVEYLPSVLAVSVLLELAPIGAGLIVAARTGASLAAEIAAMKNTEQLDALELLGISALKVLIGPRVMACMIALPLLHIFISALALGSGFVAQSVVTNASWEKYQVACLRELYLIDVIPGALKTVVFGLLIGVSGCFAGLKAQGGTEGVGRAATQGVVVACLLVIASDVFLVGLIKAVLG